MSALALSAALVALSAHCASTVAPGTTLSFARGESGLDPFAIHSNADGRAYHPATKEQAIAIASAMLARGERPDLGFMQINAANLGWLGLSISAAFDTCQSIQAGARVLHAGFDPCMDAGGEAQACLRRAASLYNTGSPTRGFANGYVRLIAATAEHVIPEIRVAGTAAGQEPSPPAATSAPAPVAPCVPPRPDDWHLSAEQTACAPADSWHAGDAVPETGRVDEADPPVPAPSPPRKDTDDHAANP